MTNDQILTEKAVIEGLLITTSNELLQAKVTNRLMKRLDFKNELGEQQKQQMGQMQSRERALEKTLSDLKEFHKEAKTDNPLADITN